MNLDISLISLFFLFHVLVKPFAGSSTAPFPFASLPSWLLPYCHSPRLRRLLPVCSAHLHSLPQQTGSKCPLCSTRSEGSEQQWGLSSETQQPLFPQPGLHTRHIFLKLRMVIMSPFKNLWWVCTLKLKTLHRLNLKIPFQANIPQSPPVFHWVEITDTSSQTSLVLSAYPFSQKLLFLQCNAWRSSGFSLRDILSCTPCAVSFLGVWTCENDGMSLLGLGQSSADFNQKGEADLFC